MFDRSQMGNPYRLLDTRRSSVKSDRTYEVLSGLSELVGGVFQMQYDSRKQDMERQAKNDLVNNSINPDLQRHERIYAETVAKGQALDTFNDLKNKVQTGEFDRMAPEDFQEEMNRLHAKKAAEYSEGKYGKEAVEKWNNFWVQQESTLTAGQAGKYRIALGKTQEKTLSENLAKMGMNGNYKAEDYINEVYSEDYSMLSVDERLDSALAAASIRAAEGDDSLLKVLDAEFEFSDDPKRYKVFDTAQKTAHRVQHSNAEAESMNIRKEYKKEVAAGTLTEDYYMKEVRPGVSLAEARDPNGNYIVSYREMSEDLIRSNANFVKNVNKDRGRTAVMRGRDTYDLLNTAEYNKTFGEIASQALQNSQNPRDTFFKLGQIASAQTHTTEFFKSVGTTFADAPLVQGNEVSQSTAENYHTLEAARQGYGNDAKFYRALGTDAAARFKMIQNEFKFTQGSIEDRTAEALRRVEQVRERKEKNLIKDIQTIPDTVQTEIEKSVKTALEDNDSLWRIDKKRLESVETQDVIFMTQQRYKDLVNNYGMSPEVAQEHALEQVIGSSTEFDGSLVFTGGAEFDFGADNEYTVKTMKNDPAIAAMVAEKHSSGWDTDLTGNTEPTKIPDWEEVRMVPNPDTGSVMLLDSSNEIIGDFPQEHIQVLNAARKQYVNPVSKGVKDLFGKVMQTQEEYSEGQGIGTREYGKIWQTQEEYDKAQGTAPRTSPESASEPEPEPPLEASPVYHNMPDNVDESVEGTGPNTELKYDGGPTEPWTGTKPLPEVDPDAYKITYGTWKEPLDLDWVYSPGAMKIEHVKRFVNFNTEENEKFALRVVHGDTQSIMQDIEPPTPEQWVNATEPRRTQMRREYVGKSKEAVEHIQDTISGIRNMMNTPRSQADIIPANQVHKYALYGNKAIKAVEKLEGELTPEQKRVIELEAYVPKKYFDTSGHLTYGVGQTGKYMNIPFKDAFAAHEADLKNLIPAYDSFPTEVRAELMQGMYRGDILDSPKTRALINSGQYAEAADEFLDHEEYRTTDRKQIRDRIKALSDAIRKLEE